MISKRTGAGLVAGLVAVAGAVDGRGQSVAAGVAVERMAQAAPPPAATAPTPPARRSSAPAPQAWPQTTPSTERRPPTTGAVPPTPRPPTVVAPQRGVIPKPAVVEKPPSDSVRRVRRVAAPRQEQATAFDASLEMILHSADRKLAIVDGRIVQIGDEIGGARIVAITPSVVQFRDANGRLRTLSLGR